MKHTFNAISTRNYCHYSCMTKKDRLLASSLHSPCFNIAHMSTPFTESRDMVWMKTYKIQITLQKLFSLDASAGFSVLPRMYCYHPNVSMSSDIQKIFNIETVGKWKLMNRRQLNKNMYKKVNMNIWFRVGQADWVLFSVAMIVRLPLK